MQECYVFIRCVYLFWYYIYSRRLSTHMGLTLRLRGRCVCLFWYVYSRRLSSHMGLTLRLQVKYNGKQSEEYSTHNMDELNPSSYCSTPLQDWEKTEVYQKQQDIMAKVAEARTGLKPKPAQLRFAMALFLGYDVSCVAATGFGKSLAFQMSAMVMKQFGIVITPLNRLGKDQVTKCKKYGLQAVMLTGEVLETDKGIIKRIMKGEYDLGMYTQIT